MAPPTPSRPPDSIQPIKPLPESTTHLLRSTLVIPSLPSCLVELVQNALDAQASKIEVSIDLDTWTIRCDDNGCGMDLDTLRALGEGERYWTSKAMPGDALHETFGFRGEALASMAQNGLLEIVTEKHEGSQALSLVIRGGKRLYVGKAIMGRATGRGSTVWVRDLFYKWPVRRKSLSTASARASLLSNARQSLATISLLHPDVSFYFTDVGTSTSAPKKLLTVSRSSEGLLGRWRQLWGRAGSEQVWTFDVREEEQHLTDPAIRAQGFFSLSANRTKSAQLIYVNSRPLALSPLHKVINDRFASSSFGRHASAHIDSPSASPAPYRMKKSPSTLKSATAERCPIFVLNLIAPPSMVDVTLEPEKRVVEFQDERRVQTFVLSVVERFLREQGYISTMSKATLEGPPTPLPTPPPQQANDNAEAVSTSIMDRLRSHHKRHAALPVPAAPSPAKKRKRSDQLASVPREGSALTVFPEPTDDSPAAIRWIDTRTNQSFLIDTRTGNSLRSKAVNERDGQAAPARVSGANYVDRSALSRSLSSEGERAKPQWLEQTLRSWSNPVFPSSKRGISSISAVKSDLTSAVPPALSTSRSSNRSSRQVVDAPQPLTSARRSTISSYFSDSAHVTASSRDDMGCGIGNVPALVTSGTQRFSRDSIRAATLIAQLDRKFLLVRIRSSVAIEDRDGGMDTGTSTPGDTLAVIDQHAASERVRVQRYLAATCGRVARGESVETQLFEEDEPARVLLSLEEARIAEAYRAEFVKWGMPVRLVRSDGEGDCEDEGGEGDYAQVELLGVPRIVADRLRSDSDSGGRVQQELVRSFAAHLADGGGRSTATTVKDRDDATWQSALGSAPPVLLDLINSKACRGAIMFNDDLTPSQSHKLLAQLADTAFPFQCAHGRPSLIPLVNLPSCARSPSTSTLKANGSAEAKSSIDWSRLGVDF